MKVNIHFRDILTILKYNAANIITFIGLLLAFQIVVILWEVVSIYVKSGTKSWSEQTAWTIIILAVLAILTDYSDGKVARSKWGEITDFGRSFDKIRDKCIITFFFVNMIRSLYAVPITNTIPYILVRMNIALSISLMAMELFLFLIGIVAIIKKYDADANIWGKWKMVVECATAIIWLIVFLSPCPFRANMGSYVFMAVLMVLLATSNYLAARSIHGYWTKYSNNQNTATVNS